MQDGKNVHLFLAVPPFDPMRNEKPVNADNIQT